MKELYEYANPWGLSPMQCETLDAVCKFGNIRLASLAMKKSPHTLLQHTQNAGKKMGHTSTLVIKCLMWDRFRRG